MRPITHKGKKIFKCEMCGNIGRDAYEWTAYITNIIMEICVKCAKREAGSKHWPPPKK